MEVHFDPHDHHVILTGAGGYEARLDWAAALNLGSLLIKKAEEAEPPAMPGKTYCPSTERDRR
ncbi:MAG: hypothetical protein CV090_14825 [Nitrospira sp. WS238]|nr:hypothetical protein [Nitrospira sp. WS238]